MYSLNTTQVVLRYPWGHGFSILQGSVLLKLFANQYYGELFLVFVSGVGFQLLVGLSIGKECLTFGMIFLFIQDHSYSSFIGRQYHNGVVLLQVIDGLSFLNWHILVFHLVVVFQQIQNLGPKTIRIAIIELPACRFNDRDNAKFNPFLSTDNSGSDRTQSE